MIGIYGLTSESMRKAGVSNCAGHVFYKLGLEEEDFYIDLAKARAYLSKMKTSEKPVDKSIMVMIFPGDMHLGLIQRKEGRFYI